MEIVLTLNVMPALTK